MPRCDVCGTICPESELAVANPKWDPGVDECDDDYEEPYVTVGRERCPNPDCEQFAEQVDEWQGDEGPMMCYSYELPAKSGARRECWTLTDAIKIADLPLVIVYFNDDPTDAALALSGGGMNFSWEICEAYMRLGFLPPTYFADLPEMAGLPRTAVDRWVIAGCEKSFKVQRRWADAALAHLAKF